MIRLRDKALTQAESQAQSMLTDQAGSAKSMVIPPAINHNAIIAQALGHHSRWVKGIRLMPRLEAVRG
ncbi:hypothetical protein TorRG33x02_264420 [Trema orientale]|uniref:Uncharacterized protein n=1 Tax=Trema orientale TaxID=63057 RepID=A0A2P5D2S0_TREOI|nr:hypothetical protein TorRG33x02_264420 [Trema orientale]